MGRIFVVFIRRLRLPFLLFAGFGLLCMRVYMRLEELRWQDALFWILNPHAIVLPNEVRDLGSWCGWRDQDSSSLRSSE